jgi:hypothetical protein
MTAHDPADLRELGIDASGDQISEAAASEPEIAAETAARGPKKPLRRRAGPLPPEDRAEFVSQTVASLRRTLLALLLATEDPAELNRALASVHLELRRYPPGLDGLASQIGRSL